LTSVLNLGASPLADDFPTEPNSRLRFYPLELLRCGTCNLVQLSEIVPDNELWGGDYGFYTGSSWVAAQQQKAYAEELLRTYRHRAQMFTVEIACNDGTMLKNFAEAGCATLGVDPAEGPVRKAREAGLDVWQEEFCLATAQQIVSEHGYAGLVVANNVVAHVSELSDFLAGVAHLIGPSGIAVFEFQYLADLVTGNMIDHIYHEHRFFFSLDAFRRAIEPWGMQLVRVEQTSPQGGSLRVHVCAGEFVLTQDNVYALLAREAWLQHSSALAGMQGRAYRIRDRLLEILHKAKRDGKLVAGYGASAKSTTLLNFCDLDTELVQYFVDATPMKWGRYTPGTSIPIVDPTADSRRPDIYLLTIWNYASQIIRRETSFEGQWLVPIPVPVLL
jgi:ubiquinone/menaquinone biosynthesis C-methylase UbiE